MSGGYILGIDNGSQSTKVVIYDLAGHAVAAGRQALRPANRPRPGVVEHPDDDLWDSVTAATRQALGTFRGDPAEIVGVGLCAIRCCKAFLREDGSLVQPVMSWMDARAYEPYLPEDPAVAYATTSSGYLTHRLTGEFRDTAANSIALQWPIDVDAWQWSRDDALIRRFNLRRDMLFELLMPGEVAGRVTSAAAAATGIPAGLPVVVTANDKAVEALGSGSLDEHTALVSLGTYIAGMMHGREHRADASHFWTNFACAPHRYLYESHGIRRGMWTLSWLMDVLGPEFAESAAAQHRTREAILEAEAATVPAGSDGLLTVLDWLAPGDHPYRKGVMLGFDARHTRGHLYRSMLEAIALTMADKVEAMRSELGARLDEVVVSGGGSESPLLMQIFADAFGVPSARALGPGGASLGAAICVAVALGVYPDFDTGIAQMEQPRQRFLPRQEHVDLYRQVSETVFRHVRDATDPILQRSYPIFQ